MQLTAGDVCHCCWLDQGFVSPETDTWYVLLDFEMPLYRAR